MWKSTKFLAGAKHDSEHWLYVLYKMCFAAIDRLKRKRADCF